MTSGCEDEPAVFGAASEFVQRQQREGRHGPFERANFFPVVIKKLLKFRKGSDIDLHLGK